MMMHHCLHSFSESKTINDINDRSSSNNNNNNDNNNNNNSVPCS